MSNVPNPKKKDSVRIYVDGCFDVVHYGHANALRQARQLGDELFVGLHTDEEISRHKGPPVYTLEERCIIVRSIKWVDHVVEGAPYFTYLETLDKYECDFSAHGDDITISAAEGLDTYHVVKNSGRYKEFKRTEGISTTDLVGRMLLATRTHHQKSGLLNKDSANEMGTLLTMSSTVQASDQGPDLHSPYTGTNQFMATTQRIIQFSEGRDPLPGQRVVYVSGAFDLFHVGHIKFLQKCAEIGDYVIVGVHNDQVVNQYRGLNFPIMNLYERVLSVLACRYVSNIVIGAPYTISEDLMSHFKVDVVCHGKSDVAADVDGKDPYEVPKRLGKFQIVDSGCDLTTAKLITRIIDNRIHYEARNSKKQTLEVNYISNH